MKNKNEIRSYKVEVRANSDRVIKGLGIPANKPSRDLGFIEYITPQAISKALSRNKDITLLVAHDNSRVIARNGRNMTLTATSSGLEFEASLLAADDDTYQKVKAGLYDSCSFGFIVLDDSYAMVDGQLTRYVNDMDIIEISVLSNDAAYVSTHVDARAIRKISSKLKRSDTQDQQDTDNFCDCDDSEVRCINCDSSADDCTCPDDDQQLRCTRCLRDLDPDDDACEDRTARGLLVATILKRRLLYT